MLVQFVPKCDDERDSLVVITCGKKLCTQDSYFVFHSTQWRLCIQTMQWRDLKLDVAGVSVQYRTSCMSSLIGRFGSRQQSLPSNLPRGRSNRRCQVSVARRLWVGKRFGVTIASSNGASSDLLLLRVSGPKAKVGGATLPGETKEHWKELCMRAIVEQDPNKFAATIQELIRALDEDENERARGQGYAGNRGSHLMNEGLHDRCYDSFGVYDRGIWWS